jgi:hypothetical protein
MDPSDIAIISPVVEIHLRAKELEIPTLFQITNFLYDVNLIYELARLATDPRYEDFRFSRYAYFRDGRPLRDEDRLRVFKLTQESPLDLILVGAAAGGTVIGGIWGLVQILEKVSTFRLNRQKLQEELIKLRRENEAANRPSHIMDEEEAMARIRTREAIPLVEGVGRRLSGSQVIIEELEVTLTKRVRRTRQEQK